MSALLSVPVALGLGAAGLLAVLGVVAWARRAPGREERRRDTAAAALLLALVAGFFWRPLFTSGSWLPIGGGDLASFFYPLYSFIYQSIHAGQFPLWNPYAFSGMPLAADVQSGLFYPPNLLAWLLLPSYTYGTLELLLIGHYLAAAVGMFVWLRALRLPRVAALTGAAAFAFCGFMAAHFGHMPMIFTAAWLPWNLWLAQRAATRANPWWVVTAGLALACTFLAGHPQTTLYEGLALALYWVFLVGSGATLAIAAPPPGPRARRTAVPPTWGPALRRLPVILLIAAGVSGVQLLPAQELAGQSLRAGISYEQAGEFALQPVSLLSLVLPRVFGANALSYSVPWQSTETWGYLGAIALLVALLGLVLRRDRRQGFLVALGVGALLLAVGPFSILFSWVQGLLPGFKDFRAPGRFLLLLGLANAGLVALGVDALWRILPHSQTQVGALPPGPAERLGAPLVDDAPAGPAQVQRLRVLGLAVAGGTGLWLLLLPLLTTIFLAGFALDRAQTVLNDAYMLAVWLVVFVGLLWATLRGRLPARIGAALIVVLLILDLFSPNSHFNPTSTDILGGYEQPNAVAYLQQYTGPPDYYRIDSGTDVSPVWAPMLGTLAGIPDASGVYNPLELQRYATYWATAQAHVGSVLYDLLSIRYRLAVSPTLIADPKFTRVATGNGNLLIAQNAQAHPRLFLVHDAVVEPDDSTALGKLLNGTVLGWHTIYLDSGPASRSATPSTLETGNPGEGARITAYMPNAITAVITATQPGWAVFSENWYPGWEATVDGQPAPSGIQRADTIFRAIAVPAGTHTVDLRFAPPSLIAGLQITGATLFLTLVLGLAAYAVYRRDRPVAPPPSAE